MSDLESKIVFGEGQDSCLYGALALFAKNEGGTVIFLERESHFYYYPPGADPDTVEAENLGEVFDGSGNLLGTVYEPLTQTEAVNQGGIDRTVLIEGLTRRPRIMKKVEGNRFVIEITS